MKSNILYTVTCVTKSDGLKVEAKRLIQQLFVIAAAEYNAIPYITRAGTYCDRRMHAASAQRCNKCRIVEFRRTYGRNAGRKSYIDVGLAICKPCGILGPRSTGDLKT